MKRKHLIALKFQEVAETDSKRYKCCSTIFLYEQNYFSKDISLHVRAKTVYKWPVQLLSYEKLSLRPLL